MSYLEEKEGGVFCIPLFLPNDLKDNRKNYSSSKYDSNLEYAFGRLIEIDKSTGDLIEIFNYIGSIPVEKKVIIESGQMFTPIRITQAFEKKRWKFIFESENYKKEIDSNYSEICFVQGDRDFPILWKGGNKSNISIDEAKKYKRWVIHHPTRIEEAIRSKDFSMII
ncbi:Imm26 family immunity protein [Flavobacterium aestivum]|uniref:Imm26 family immunity protein n=1 Tax=Flavobacterium aestivum TaxID=3003257 RepID=UPI002285BA91|nr:Imm26 family immunity protein [Flavobacterium aestivum]